MVSVSCSECFVVLATPQLAAVVAYYSALTGRAPEPYILETYAEFSVSGLKLGIFQPKPDNQAEFAAPGSGTMSLCLEVLDLDTAIAQLVKLGYPPRGVPVSASHGREIYAYDPDGNRLILHES